VKLNAVRIPCRDLYESEVYYSQSIGWPKIFGSNEEGYVGFDLKGTTIILELEEVGEFECGRYLGFSVTVEDLNGFFLEAEKRGVEFTGPPERQDWGGTMTHIRDCSGNTFSVVEQEVT
jgi:predicted enzyme related to lactoylglutathione lyase